MNRRTFIRNLALGLAALPFGSRLLGNAQATESAVAAPETLELPGCATPEAAKQVAYDILQDREYRVTGLRIKVPSNYDPVARTYAGDWGYRTFHRHTSDNPAYILVDLTERAGGEPDWKQIYEWGRYCDEPVIESVTTQR